MASRQSLSRLVLQSSRIGIYYSIAALVAALYVVTEGLRLAHAELMTLAVLPVFVVSVAAAYGVSGLRQTDPLYAAAASLAVAAPISAAALSVASVALSKAWLLSAALAYSFVPLAMGSLASRAKLDVRLSVGLLGLSLLLGAAELLLVRAGFFVRALLFLELSVLGAIYAVSIHAFPSTFGDPPSVTLSALTFALLAAGLALAVAGLVRAGVLVAGIPMITYLFAMRLERIESYFKKAYQTRNPVARAGTLYFVDGHAFAAAFSAISFIAVVLWYLGLAPTLVVVHLVAIGLVGTYIFIHAPMMLPVILRWTSARRYNLTPYVLLAAGAALWPVNMHVSFFFVGLAIIFLVLIVKPSKHPYPLWLGE